MIILKQSKLSRRINREKTIRQNCLHTKIMEKFLNILTNIMLNVKKQK